MHANSFKKLQQNINIINSHHESAKVAFEIEKMNRWSILKSYEQIKQKICAQTYIKLSIKSKNYLQQTLSEQHIVNILKGCDVDDLIFIYHTANTAFQNKLIKLMSKDQVALILAHKKSVKLLYQNALHYRNILPSFWLVKEALQFIKHQGANKVGHNIILIDNNHNPEGYIATLSLMLNISNKMIKNIELVRKVQFEKIGTTAQNMLNNSSKYSGSFVVLVDNKNRTLGVIRKIYLQKIENLSQKRVISQTIGMDIEDESAYTKGLIIDAWQRSLGIAANMTTAVFFVVGASWFSSILSSQMAMLYPVVTGLSGAFGAQTIARTLGKKEFKTLHLYREAISGIIVASIYAVAIFVFIRFFSFHYKIAYILGTTLMLNMIWASVVGALLPIFSKYLKTDPYIFAGPFLAATTDVIGFCITVILCHFIPIA